MIPGQWPRPPMPGFPYVVPGAVPGYPPMATPPVQFPQSSVPLTLPITPLGGIPLASTVVPTEEEIDDRKNLVEMQSDAHYNMNAMLAQNILASDYFKSLYELKTYQEVVDEIWEQVDHLEPFAIGKTRLPSTSFSLLYKLFIMKLTHKQLKGLVTYKKAPYIRGIGFLFIRFVVPPEKMWDWYEPYLDDPEQFSPGGDRVMRTMGEFIRQLLDDIKYYGTILRRIPVKLAREIKKKIIMHDMKAKSKGDEDDGYTGELQVGMKVKAKYSDGQYYDVTVDEITKDQKYIVTWVDYGTQDELDLDAFKASTKKSSRSSSNSGSSNSGSGGSSRSKRGGSRERSKSKSSSRSSRKKSRSRSRGRGKKKSSRSSRSKSSSKDDRRKSKDEGDRRKRSGSGSRSPKRSSSRRRKSRSPSQSGADIEQAILDAERRAAVAQGTDYARKPVGYKKALSLQLTVGTSRRRSRSRSRSRDRDPEPRPSRSARPRERTSSSSSNNYRNRSISPPKKKEMTAAQKMQMSKLKEIYGDASGGKKAKTNYAASKPSAKVDSEEVLRLGF